MAILSPILQPICGPILRGIGDQYISLTVDQLYEAMSNPSLPMPIFVEGWAVNSWNGQSPYVPNGVANLPPDSEGARILNLTVTGSLGATTLTGVGFDVINGAGSWGCTILHDDGTYGVYSASGITATAITVSPPLRAAVTAKNLASIGAGLNGQHYGLQGYTALAQHIFQTTIQEGYRLRYAKSFVAQSMLKTEWGLLGGLSPSGVGDYTSPSNAFQDGSSIGFWTGRSTSSIRLGPLVHAGYGVSHTATLAGKAGFLETFVSGGTAIGAVNVTVTFDGSVVYNQNITGLQRIIVPFSSVTTGVLSVTTATASSTNPRVGDTTWWVYDRALTPTDSVIDKNGKIVILGDSWSARYSGGFGAALNSQMVAAGGTGTVTTVAVPGMTSEWGLSQFDSQVAPLNPTHVVIEFFVNDYNSFGVANSNRWLHAVYSIARKCQTIGATPVIIMPLPTQSIGQAAGLGIWSERVGSGLPS